MIRLTCNNCKKGLEIDEAFAGGVCRCMYCGTIQTVPSHLRPRPAAAEATAAGTTVKNSRASAASSKITSKSLYNKDVRPAVVTPATRLDELADVVAGSSGLAGSGLRGAATPATRLPHPPIQQLKWWQQRPVMFSIVGGAVGAALLVVVILMSAPTAQSTAAATTPPAHPAAPAPAGPTFCGVALKEDAVVYVLDCGSATGEMFGHLKEACFRSVETLGSDRKFQIIFWNNGTSDNAFPRGMLTYATTANIHAARQALQDVHAHGQSDAKPALQRAFAGHPGVIVLATGKAYELDEGFVQMVELLRGTRVAKIHTFSLGSGDSGRALVAIATKTGGEFRTVPHADLRQFAE